MERLDEQTGTGPATQTHPAAPQPHPAAQPQPAPQPPYAAQPPYAEPAQPWIAQPAGPPYAGPPPGSAAPEPERPKWSTRRTTAVTAAAAAAVLAIGGVAVAHSGSGDGTAAAAQGAGGPGAGLGRVPGGGGQTGLTGALHGTFVTQGTDGTYVTRLLQTGEVTAVSATSISVTSADGYAKTYTLSGATTVNAGRAQVGAIRTGHTVTVVASEAGAATTVTDQSPATTGQGGFPGQGVPGQGVPGQQGGTT